MTPAEIAHLFSLTNEYRSIKYDLRNIQILLERLGNPHQSLSFGADRWYQRQGLCGRDVVRNDAGRRAVHVATSAAAEREVQDRQPRRSLIRISRPFTRKLRRPQRTSRRFSTRRHILK